MWVKKAKGFVKKMLLQTSVRLSPYPRLKKAYLFILPAFLAERIKHFQCEQHRDFRQSQNKVLSPREEILYQQCIRFKQLTYLKGKK